jgi:hypothetical protein
LRGVAAIVLVSTAPVLRAQSLADAARREKERRAKVKADGPVKIYSDSDIAGLGGPKSATEAPDAQPSPGSATSGSATSAGTPPSPSGQGEGYWRGRAQQARTAVEQAERRISELE